MVADMEAPNKKNLLLNLLFAAVCLGVFLFLWNAPPETTAKIPHDQDHQRFFAMERKEAEKFCEECHRPEGTSPLPSEHPPKYRCLFCHKQK